MPAPIAVLRDIADRGLDPNKAYGRIGSDGRLAHSPGDVNHENVPLLTSHDENETRSAVGEHLEEVPVAEVVNEKVGVEQSSPVKKPRGKKPLVESY